MADIKGTYTLNSNPAVPFTVAYDVRRRGTEIDYRFRVTVSAMQYPSYYGYNLYWTIILNNKTVLSGGTIKDSSPSTWNAFTVYAPSQTGWYTVSNVGTQSTLPVQINFGSQTGNSAASGGRTVSVPAAKGPTAPNIQLSATTAVHTDSISVGVSGGSWGDGAKSKYIYYYRLRPATQWTSFIQGGGTSAGFKPSSYGGGYGSVFDFKVTAVNTLNLTADTKTVTLTCASQPGAPGSLSISPSPMRRADKLTLRWSAPAAGSGSVSAYEVSARYYNGTSWTGSTVLGTVTTLSFATTPSAYGWCQVKPRGILEFSVRAKNSYGVWSGSAAVRVTVRGGLAAFKTGGAWKNDCQVWIKINGSWKEADVLLVKTGGSWKEQS